MIKYAVCIEGSSFCCEYEITEDEYLYVMEDQKHFNEKVYLLAFYAINRYCESHKEDKFAGSIVEEWFRNIYSDEYSLKIYAED